MDYLKRGSYNSFFFGLSSAIVRALNFLFLPYLLSQISLEEFGIWEFYQMLFSYGTLLLSSYAATGMIRFFLLYKDNSLKQMQAIGNSFLASFLGACATIFTALILYYGNVAPARAEYIVIISTSIAFFTLFSMVLAYIRMHEKVVWYLVLFCGQNIIATMLTLLGVAAGYRLRALWYANVFSFIIFLPLFIRIWIRHRAYSYEIFKQQITYSLPLLIYSFLYTSFLSIDRWFIQQNQGYEALGTYALLWRFGALFQFVAIAIMDTWPLLIFNAQKERDGQLLIAQLMRSFCIAIATVGLYAMIGSYAGIMYFFPVKYNFLTAYLPSFFIPLVCLEIARVLQAGFALATRTNYIPLIGAIIVPLQALFLYFTSWHGLWGIFLANSTSFIIYGAISHKISNALYPLSFSLFSVTKILSVFGICIAVAHLCISYRLNFLFIFFGVGLLWPILIFTTNIITQLEQKKLGKFMRRLVIKNLKYICPPMKNYNNKPLESLLYLRTDICAEELTAGGSVTHTLGVIDGFKNRGTKVIIASCAMPTILQEKYSNDFIRLKVSRIFIFLRWKLNYLRWRLESFFSTFFFARSLRLYFKKNSFDLIYQRYSLLNATGVLLSVRYKIPLILEYNSSEVWQFDQLAPKNWFKFNWLARLIEEINLEYAQTIVVVSQALKDDLVIKGFDSAKILVNPNGVDANLYDPEKLIDKRNQIRSELSIEDRFVFGFVGTFSFWHGIETIADMIPDVIKKIPRAHFLLIGDGILKPYIENEIKRTSSSSNVTLTGLVNAQIAREYLAACDAFLCPTQQMPDGTRFFGSPTKMFEYLSMGKPIIASNLEQITELMNPSLINPQPGTKLELENKLGILVDPKNLSGFIDAAIILATASFTEIQMINKNSRDKAILNYSWQKNVDSIILFLCNR